MTKSILKTPSQTFFSLEKKQGKSVSFDKNINIVYLKPKIELLYNQEFEKVRIGRFNVKIEEEKTNDDIIKIGRFNIRYEDPPVEEKNDIIKIGRFNIRYED